MHQIDLQSHCRWLVAATLALLLGLSGAAPASTSDSSITPAVAALFVDQQKIVEGPVTDAERDANTVRLRLGKPPQTLAVSLIIGLLSKFPADPERFYLGKTVRVVGTIHTLRGAIEMVIHAPANIAIAGAPHSASGTAASGAAASDAAASDTTVHDNIDALKQRVRELEDQVRQLQRSGGNAP